MAKSKLAKMPLVLAIAVAAIAGIAGCVACRSVPCTPVPCTAVDCIAVPCLNVPGLGGPTPGPPIDIVIDGGGNMSFSQDNGSAMTVTNTGGTPKLDPTFFASTPVVQLVDAGANRIWQIKKSKALVVTFTNGKKLEILRKPNGNLEYTCVDGATRTLVGSGSDNDLPQCMAYTADDGKFAYTDSATVHGSWLHIETDF